MMCVCDKIDWMENGWMDWIEWMWKVDVESGKWKVESGAVPDLTPVQVDQIKPSGIVERYIVLKTSGSIKERTQTSTEMGGGCQQNGCRKGFA